MHRLTVLAVLTSVVLLGCAQGTAELTLNGTSFSVQVADTPNEWTEGLGQVEQLAPNEGMVFIFPEASAQTFWMKDVEYPIDIIWVADHQVTGYITAQPEAATTALADYVRYPSPGQVDMVIELPAVTARTLNVQLGDPVELTDQ